MSLEEAEKVRLEKLGGAEPSRLTGSLMSSLFPAGVKSPEYNADGTVTFRFQAPDAESVELFCDMLPFRNPTKAMEKDDRGVWTLTLTPPAPDVYRYSFTVNYRSYADPNNMHIAPSQTLKAAWLTCVVLNLVLKTSRMYLTARFHTVTTIQRHAAWSVLYAYIPLQVMIQTAMRNCPYCISFTAWKHMSLGSSLAG